MSEDSDKGGLRTLVLRGGVFLFVRQLFSVGLGLIGVMVITRVIGPEHYGSYTAALGISQFTLLLGPAGVGVYLIRQSGQVSDNAYRQASTLLLLVSLVVVLFLEVSAELMASWINVADVDALLRFLALLLPFQFLSIVASAKLERTLDYRRVGLIEVSGHVLYYVAAVPAAFAGLGPWSLAAGWCVQQLFQCVAFHIASHHVIRPTWDGRTAVHMLTYSGGYSVANCLWQLRFLVNAFVVGHYLGAQAVGQVGLAIRLVEILSFGRGVAIRLSIAALARIQDQPEKLARAITMGMQLQVLAIAPLLLGLGWLGPAILPDLFGPRWDAVMEIYPFVAIGYLTNALFSMHSSVLSLLHRNGRIAIFNVVHLALFAPAVAIAVQKFGIIGYGIGEIACLISYVLFHFMAVRAVGRPEYTIALLWWSGAVVGLLWTYLGWWAIAAPFLVLVWPISFRQLRSFVSALRNLDYTARS